MTEDPADVPVSASLRGAPVEDLPDAPAAPDDGLVDIGFEVRAVSEPTLEDAARAVMTAMEREETRIRDAQRLNWAQADYETDVWTHASLKLALKMLNAIIPHAEAVRAFVKAEIRKAAAARKAEAEAEAAQKARVKAAIERKRAAKAAEAAS